MKKLLAVATLFLLFQAPALARAEISFSINVGGPPVVVAQPPDFLYPSELGFGVAVGVPYDIFYISGVYYLYRGGGWYRAPYYGAGWARVSHRALPLQLRKYRISRIREFRDRDYRMYRGGHFRGQHFRPEGRGERHEMRGPGPREHREMRGGPGERGMRERGHGEGGGMREHGHGEGGGMGEHGHGEGGRGR